MLLLEKPSRLEVIEVKDLQDAEAIAFLKEACMAENQIDIPHNDATTIVTAIGGRVEHLQKAAESYTIFHDVQSMCYIDLFTSLTFHHLCRGDCSP